MSPPDLVIFDIDATLLIPSAYHSPEHVREGLYDDQLLILFLANPKYQVAIASFNHDADLIIYGGRRLGRAILDLQHPTGDSRQNVQDEFIQAWRLPTAQQMEQHGKNEHIRKILQAYHQKYNQHPPKVILYDDCIENVYLAGKNGIHAYWVTTGLTRDNIHTVVPIANRVQFSTQEDQISYCDDLQVFLQYIYKQPHSAYTTPIYSLYLPPDRQAAKSTFAEFLQRAYNCSINIHILTSDLNDFMV